MPGDRILIAERILMTADTVGGVWTYALELSRALAAGGTGIVLATMGAPLSRDQWIEAGVIPHLEIAESAFKLEWMERPWEDVRAAGEWLLELERRHAPDLIHLNNYCHGALPFRAPVLVVGHSCVLSWWRAVRGGTAPDEWDRYRREVRRGLQAASLVAAPTRAMLEALQQHYGPLERTAVIPNGRTCDSAPGRLKEPFVFTSGRLWDEAKNVAALARAAPGLPWPVYAAGESRHPDGREPPPGGCRFLGRLSAPSMAVWMARAAIYAAPAKYEPFGLSILEAALAGCALVLGDIPSLRELWDDAAVFVPPMDVDALEAALRELIRDPALRLDLAQRALRRSGSYSAGRMALAYREAYARILTTAAL